MTDIRFYHLERSALEQALPELASKVYEMGHKIIVKTVSAQRAEALSTALWTHYDRSFLPHGTQKDGYAQWQPIWITHETENPNQADVLILADGAEAGSIDAFSVCCLMFDGRNESEKAAARAQWSEWQKLGHDLTYWQQGDKGWVKKAF